MRLIDADKLCMYLADVQYINRGWKEDICDILDDVMEAVDEQPTIEQPKWISCAERLPEKNGYYLIAYQYNFNGRRTTIIDFYAKTAAGEWWGNDFGRIVTHWMPLPEPPKENE